MNLSPEWLPMLRRRGLEAVHWSTVGAGTASDREICQFARSQGFIVMTQDLDFSQVLFETAAAGPSVILLRVRHELDAHVQGRVVELLVQCRNELCGGALLVIDEKSARIRTLPIF